MMIITEAAPQREWPLIPRTSEAAAITRGLERQPPRVQLVVGPAGIGKTVLATAVADASEHRTVLRAIALAELAGVPLGALGPVLGQLGLPTEPERAVPALVAAVGSAADRFLLLVDDIPRLDDVSAAAIYQLVRGFGVPTVATARLGERLPAPIQRMVDEGLTERHDLAGLRLEQVGELLDERFRNHVAYSDVKRLTERTSGNPLYLRVLVERAERTGRVGVTGDTVHIDEGDAPTDLVDAVTARMSELTPEQRRVLRLAALLQPVSRRVLAENPAEEQHLAALESRGLITTELGSDRCRLAHPLIAESLERNPESPADFADAARRLRSTGTDRNRLLAVRIEQKSATPPIKELAWATTYAYGTGDLTLAAELAKTLLAQNADPANRCSALTTLASTQSLLGDLDAADESFAEAEQLAHSADELALIAVRRGEHLSYRRFDLTGAVNQAERIRARINQRSEPLDNSIGAWGASLDVVAGMPLLGRLAFTLRPELAIRSALLLVVS
ncbi:MAG TPA: hypothetical protein PK781_07420, partial [Terrimesophilobacter sp.]|nr:hypothetical protein [Terrimesophilobacter sp.]